jgi:DNA-binding response OmpR family regulator
VAEQRLLLVEDDAVVGPTIVEFLQRAGYAVHLAADGDAAVAAAQEHEFDLVISDLVLGTRDGNDVVEALLVIQPQLKVLFMSGYAAPRYGSSPEDPILVKPFEPKELVDRVAKLLDGSGS